MKKNILFLAFFVFFAIDSFSQKDFTFCYGSISVTMFGGGNAEMVRYNSSGSIVSRVTGTFDLYGKGSPTEVLKIQFQGKEYRYDLIRDGYGNPSKIFDNQGREYNLCKTSKSSTSNFDYEANLKNMIKESAERRTREKLRLNYTSKLLDDEIRDLYLKYKNKKYKPHELYYPLKYAESGTEFQESFKGISNSSRVMYSELKKFLSDFVIGKPYELENIIVAQNDFYDIMSWHDAWIASAALGEGWRLPTKDELNSMYINSKKIGIFHTDSFFVSGVKTIAGYWSYDLTSINDPSVRKAVEDGSYNVASIVGAAWAQLFNNGKQLISKKEDKVHYFRAVKDKIKKNVIGTPIRFDISIFPKNFEVAQYDFPRKMFWEDAIKACESLGNGWRLPTKVELDELYRNNEKISGFVNDYYWSSSEAGFNLKWSQNLKSHDLQTLSIGRVFPHYVRAVRTFKIDPDSLKKVRQEEFNKTIIGKSIKISNYEVAEYDFPKDGMNWDDANKACKALGEGWRLPTIDELKFLYLNKNEIRGFGDRSYWSSTQSSTEFDVNYRWYLNEYGNESYGNMNSANSVRAIRAF